MASTSDALDYWAFRPVGPFQFSIRTNDTDDEVADHQEIAVEAADGSRGVRGNKWKGKTWLVLVRRSAVVLEDNVEGRRWRGILVVPNKTDVSESEQMLIVYLHLTEQGFDAFKSSLLELDEAEQSQIRFSMHSTVLSATWQFSDPAPRIDGFQIAVRLTKVVSKSD
jgi:hypothetical protein